MNRAIEKWVVAACVVALLGAPGCWMRGAGGPVLISFVDYQTGKPFRNGAVYGLYCGQKLSTDGYTVENRLERIDAAVYQGDGLLGADLPKHLTAGYMYGPGVAWAERWVIAAEGFEVPEAVEWFYTIDKEPAEHVVLLRRLSKESMPFRSIQRFIASGGAAADMLTRDVPPDGLDDTTRRRIAEIVLAHYRTWRERWGDAAARERYYQRLAEAKDYDPLNRRSLADNAGIARQEWEPTVRQAETVAGRIEKMLAQSGGKKP